ncbi:MAG: hypothetical protein V3U04_00805, partial [Candidatus Aerophobetes bacterium]
AFAIEYERMSPGSCGQKGKIQKGKVPSFWPRLLRENKVFQAMWGSCSGRGPLLSAVSRRGKETAFEGLRDDGKDNYYRF